MPMVVTSDKLLLEANWLAALCQTLRALRKCCTADAYDSPDENAFRPISDDEPHLDAAATNRTTTPMKSARGLRWGRRSGACAARTAGAPDGACKKARVGAIF